MGIVNRRSPNCRGGNSGSEELPPALEAERLGDWSGIKGTHYHLLYGIHRLLTGRAGEIVLYGGNDLLVRSGGPPPELSPTGLCQALVMGRDRDEWIQLKCEEGGWTRSRLLSSGVVSTFLLNALWSEEQDRDWTVVLVSPGGVRKAEVREYADSARTFRDLDDALSRIVSAAGVAWMKWASTERRPRAPDLARIADVGLEVLSKVAESGPAPMETLRAEVGEELAHLGFNRREAPRVFMTLVGALQEAASQRPDQPLSVNVSWLEEKAGYRLRRNDLLFQDPVEACAAQLERRRPGDESFVVRCAPRVELNEALAHFLLSDRCLFVLAGEGGAGKSWASALWAEVNLDGRIRARVPGSAVHSERNLASVLRAAFSGLGGPATDGDQIYQRLVAAASPPGAGPLVLIADDVPLVADVAAAASRITDLCAEASREGVKIVLVVRQSIWQRLADERDLTPYLFLDRPESAHDPIPARARVVSFDLGPLSEEEMILVLQRSPLPPGISARQVARQMRQGAFVPLRNAYMLGMFIRHRLVPGEPIRPVDVDTLLDDEIRLRSRTIAREIGCGPETVVHALNLLTDQLWAARRTGLADGDAATTLGRVLGEPRWDRLQLFRSQDVLTPGGDIRVAAESVLFANPLFGDRLTARRMAERMKDGADVQAEMEPGQDDGVVTALVRGGVDEAVADPFAWAESLLERDLRWLRALGHGLAQRRAVTWRGIATLTAWSNRHDRGDRLAAWNAMRALGSAAARSPDARRWIAMLYHDEEPHLSGRGEFAVGAALEFVPGWAVREIRIRVRRHILAIEEGGSERGASSIPHALIPLQQVNRADAARIARRMLWWLERRFEAATDLPVEVRERLDDIVDVVRGQIAVYGLPEEIEVLLAELSEPDDERRLRAARSLLAVVQAFPSRSGIRDAVLGAARAERSERVQLHLSRLLLTYVDDLPRMVVEIIREAGFLAGVAGGMALVLLAFAGRAEPRAASAVLHDQPPGELPERRALLGEALALARWQCAAASESAADRADLDALDTAVYDELPAPCRPFATRGAAVAVLGRVALAIPGASGSVEKNGVYFVHKALVRHLGTIFLSIEQYVEGLGREIVAQPEFPALRSVLVRVVWDCFDLRVQTIDEPLRDWQRWVADDSVAALAAFARHLNDPLALVRELPPHWPALRLCDALLEAGIADPSIIDYGAKICAERHNELGSINRDRDRFMARLVEAGQLSAVLEEQARSSWILGGTDVARIEAEAKRDPGALLGAIHAHADRQSIVAIAWHLTLEAVDWRVVLLGSVLRRALMEEPLTQADCAELCDQVLEVVDALPRDALADEYRAVYGALREFVAGRRAPVPSLGPAEDLLGESHTAAMRVVAEAQKAGVGLPGERLYDLVLPGFGWVEDLHHGVWGGSFHTGVGGRIGAVYLPPALRIALAAASDRFGVEDFGARWICECAAVRNAVNGGACGEVFRLAIDRLEPDAKEERLRDALAELDAQIRLAPHHTALRACRGHVLLRMGRAGEARVELEQALSMPFHRADAQAWIRYDLACALARLGDVEGCRNQLADAMPCMREMGREHVESDPDLQSMKGERWFGELVDALPRRIPPVPG